MIRRIAATVWLGLGLIAASEILLCIDLHVEHRGAIETQTEMLRLGDQPPANFLESVARWVAINMTPIAWLGYVLFLDGITTTQTGRGPVRSRPHHFAFCALASILIWCVFDTINFYCFIPPAWTYIGLPLNWPQRFGGYVIAFAAELPGMFLTAQVILNLGWMDHLRGKPLRLSKSADFPVSLIGLALLLWAILGQNSVANYGLWCSFVLLLDPINRRLGRPSMFGDWENGWYGRSISLFAGGLICGFLWEFWNYWALAKWIYHLPFLGWTEDIRYFQMPVIGLLGFIPFAMACWAMWQTLRIPLDGLVEPLPNDATVI